MAMVGQAGRVGAMVIVGLVLTFLMYMFLTGAALRHTYTLHVLFSDATGAVDEAPVTLAGVQIGQVQDIRLTANHMADLKLEIKDRYQIPVGSTFSIITPILGSTGSVVVTPARAVAGEPSPSIKPGASNLVGQRTADIDTAFSRADVLMSQLTKTTQRSDKLIDTLTATAVSANKVISGGQIQTALNNLDAASSNGVQLTSRLSRTLQEDNDQLQEILKQTGAGTKIALGNIDSTTSQIQSLATHNRVKLNDIVDDLQSTTSSLSGITSQMNQALSQGHIPQNLGVIVSNMKTASDNLAVISTNLKQLSGDPGIQEDLRGTLHNLDTSTQESTALLERINHLIGAKTTVPSGSSLPTPPGGTPPVRLENALVAPVLLPRVDFVQNLRSSSFRADLDAVVPLPGATPGAFGRLGIYGLGSSDRGILEYGRALDPNGFVDARGGLYASKLAVGLDFGLGRPATLSLDAWDPNLLHLDATGTIMLGDGLGLLVGEQDILRRTSPSIGIEYRR